MGFICISLGREDKDYLILYDTDSNCRYQIANNIILLSFTKDQPCLTS